MRVLFWNTHKNININTILINLVQTYDVDVIVLAEYIADCEEFIETLRKNKQLYLKAFTQGCERIRFLSRIKHMTPGIQNRYYSVQIIGDIIICGVHMPSDLHGNRSEERLELSTRIMHDLMKEQKEIQTEKIIIVGDMNEMPYDRSCLNANGFHGLPALSFYEPNTRQVDNVSYVKLYNPMWNLLGDNGFPPGTYYRSGGGLHCPMWYMLDQVIISQSLIPCFEKDKLKIITKGTNVDLYNSKKHPDKKISDHFPILFEILDGGREEEQ